MPKAKHSAFKDNKASLTPHIFENHNLSQVLDAIKDQTVIDDINIAEAIQNPDFRFVVQSEPSISSQISEVLGIVQSRAMNTMSASISALGREKLKDNANDFAVKMHCIIQQLKEEKGVLTYRSTVDMLNNDEIPTSRNDNSKWHIKTIQNLEERWAELELPSLIGKPKKPKSLIQS